MRLLSSAGLLVITVACALAGGCARVTPEAGGGSGGAIGTTDASVMPTTDAGATFDLITGVDRILSTTPGVCGNGERTADEACDDGNTQADDGCAADCRSVEPGYSCAPAGRACHRIARCGDGIVVLPELCDDGNQTNGDGCSSTCKLELGYKCSGTPNTCTRTTCGDKLVEGAESCDVGDAVPFDGCSADCQSEPDCTAGACVSRCGDGIVVGEACDDGNVINGTK